MFEPNKPEMEASMNPVIKAERNNALSVVWVEILKSNTNQNTKNPGAEKNNEQIKTSKIFPISSKYVTLLSVTKMPQSNPLIKDANIQIVKVRPVNFK